MDDGMTAVHCSECRHEFSDFEAALREDPSPCPACDSTARTAYLTLVDTVSVHESMALKARPAGGGRPFLEAIYDKLEVFRQTGRQHVVTRVINRLEDKYDELIVNHASGEVIREVHEPLSQHRGYGSARGR